MLSIGSIWAELCPFGNTEKGHMSCSKLLFVAACTLTLATAPLLAQNAGSKSKLNILEGPATAKLEGIARIVSICPICRRRWERRQAHLLQRAGLAVA